MLRVRRRWKAAFPLCIFLLVCNFAWSRQRPSAIEGTVVDLKTERPLPGVQVTIGATLVLTDGDGRFVFQNLEPTSQVLSFARSGYVRTEVISDSTSRNVVVGMTRAGAVSGRLTDERGEGLEGIEVQLLRRAFDERGVEGLLEAYSTRTNDRGEYRLYWITPGTYYVTARQDDSQQISENLNSPVRAHYARSFYPGAVDASAASRLSVTTGAELNGIDWSPRSSPKVPGRSIRGRVTDSRTGRGGGSSITLTKLTPFGTDASMRNTDADGLFEFTDIAPGAYWLRAVSRDAAFASGAQASTQVEVNISDRDIDGMTLTMTQGMTISGRVTLEGSFQSTPIETLGVHLHSIVDGSVSPSRPTEKLRPDGAFTIQSLFPGPYRLEIASLPPEYFVREVRMGQLDFLGRTLVLTEAMTGPLQIVVSSNSGELDGVVLNSRRQPVPRIEAVLIPDRQRDRPELYLKTRTDGEGRFSLRGIPPGNYKLFAWQDIEPFGYFDLAVVEQADTQATPVRVTESSTQSIEVRSIP